jgi:hypothetical protein
MKDRGDVALVGAIHRTIPKKFTDVAVTAANGTQSLSGFSGQWIWLRAIGADVTIRLGTGNTIAAAGEGYVLGTADPAAQEFFVDPSDDVTLNHRASSAATLRILHD